MPPLTSSFILPIISAPQEVETSEQLCFEALPRITAIKLHSVPPDPIRHISTPELIIRPILHTHLPEPALRPHPTIRREGP